MQPLILFLKAHVKAHIRHLSSGKVVRVGAYDNGARAAAAGHRDDLTRDLFADAAEPAHQPPVLFFETSKQHAETIADVQQIAESKPQPAAVIENSSNEKEQPMTNAIHSALKARQPLVADSIQSLIEGQFEYVVRELKGPELKGIANSKLYPLWSETLRTLCDDNGVKETTPPFRTVHNYSLNHERVRAMAERRADQAVMAWADKIKGKMGELDGAEVHHMTGNQFSISGTRGGKYVRIEQDMIVNVSSKGTLFNQFPARLYVDGKFMSAEKYEAMFKDVPAAATQTPAPVAEPVATTPSAPSKSDEVTTKRVRSDGVTAAHTLVTMPDGTQRRIGKSNMMGFSGWCDLDHKRAAGAYLGDTEKEAIAELLRRSKRG